MGKVIEAKSWVEKRREREHSRFVQKMLEELENPTPGKIEMKSYTKPDGTLVFQFSPERRP